MHSVRMKSIVIPFVTIAKLKELFHSHNTWNSDNHHENMEKLLVLLKFIHFLDVAAQKQLWKL